VVEHFSIAEGQAQAPPLDIARLPGVSAALDEAAANAAPANAHLRAAWFGAEGSTLAARRPDGRVVAALPLARAPGLRGRLLSAVPGSYWPYRSFPIAADASEAELAAFATAIPDAVWRLGPVREDDAAASRFAGAAQRSGWTVLRRTLGTTYILDPAALAAGGGWPRKTTLRKNRWFEKELAKEGALDFRFLTGADWTPALFDTLAEIERNSWLTGAAERADAKFMDPAQRGFWEHAARDPEIAARMWVALLTIGGVPAAFEFDLDCAPTRYCIANSYDRRFARNSPGRVLAYRNFEHLARRGIQLLDWGSGDPGYKTQMGAAPGPEILDLLFVRSRTLARLVGRYWK
jgi:CelD/BcsL family acetyltransferase involved in cellulose biosynthesis